MFFKPDDFRAAQEREGGSVRLSDILTAQSLSLFKVDLLACVVMIPLVTLPGAVMAMNDMARRMVLEREASTREFFASLRRNLWRAWPVFCLASLLPALDLWAAIFYAGQVGQNPIFFLPCVFSLSVLLVSLLTSAYLYPLACAMPLKQAVRTSVALGCLKPWQALKCALLNFVLTGAALAFLPLSAPYFLLGGLAFPCLIGQFWVREPLEQVLEGWED